jgi:chloride channel 3/4/5
VFELTGSLTFLMPVMVSILVSKWVSEAIQKHGIYDLIINLHNHPYLNSKESHLFTSSFADLCTPRSTDSRHVLDITDGKHVTAVTLRERIAWLKANGSQDGGFPIVKEEALVGYIAASELLYALSISLPLLVGSPRQNRG